MSEFFIGYLPKAPEGIARVVRRVVLGLLFTASLVAITLVRSQHPLPAAVFEYGKVRDFDGILQVQPYPTLLAARPGATDPAEAYSAYLLVGEGKHSVGSLPADLSGQHVKLRGTLIYRDNQTAIEVVTGSVTPASRASAVAENLVEEDKVILTGEIVDTKCYLGVMNPGEGKVHRDCATRCLSGGIPPGFAVEETRGRRVVYVLAGPDGDALPPRWLEPRAGSAITLRGTRYRKGDRHIFRISPEDFPPDTEPRSGK